MSGGKGVFNTAAQSGYFDVSLLRLPTGEEWTQGSGGPGITTPVTDPTLGTTDTILNSTILPEASVTYLQTVYFDSSLFGSNPQAWYNLNLTSPTFDSAISQGGLFTLLLSPTVGDQTVNFNFQAYNQTGSLPWVTSGPHLLVSATVPEPSTISLLATLGVAVGGVLFWKCRHRLPAGIPCNQFDVIGR